MKPPKSSRAVRPLDERYLKLLTSRICANLTEDSVPLVANLVLPEGATFCEEDLTNTHLRYNYVRHSTTGSTTIENFLLHGFSKDGDWVCLYTSSAETCKDVAEARTPYACVQIQKICYTSCGRVHLKCKRLSIKKENFHMRLMMVVQAHQRT
eukprot:Em0806g1a